MNFPSVTFKAYSDDCVNISGRNVEMNVDAQVDEQDAACIEIGGVVFYVKVEYGDGWEFHIEAPGHTMRVDA